MMWFSPLSVRIPWPRLDLLSLHPVITQQPSVPFGELRRCAHVVYRRRQSIGSVPLRHFPEFPNCVLKTLTQTFKALRKTHRGRLPVRIRQHQVIDQVRKTLPLDRDPQLTHVREVTCTQPPGVMSLREEHFLHRSFRRAPHFHSSLQRAQLPIRKSPGITPLQILKDRFRFQPWVHLQQALHFFPDPLKAILSCSPSRSRRQFARYSPQPAILARRLCVHAPVQVWSLGCDQVRPLRSIAFPAGTAWTGYGTRTRFSRSPIRVRLSCQPGAMGALREGL